MLIKIHDRRETSIQRVKKNIIIILTYNFKLSQHLGIINRKNYHQSRIRHRRSDKRDSIYKYSFDCELNKDESFYNSRLFN